MATVFKRNKRADSKKTKWIVRWKDAESGQWRASADYTDKQASLALGERLEQESARRAEGLIDPTEEHRRRPICEHLDDFMIGLETGGRNSRYTSQVRSRILRMIQGTDARLLQNLDPVCILKFLSGLRVMERPLSGITRNEYIVSIKSFTNWAVLSRRIDHDPLATLKRVGRKAIKPKHPRRALTMAEIGRLLEATARRPMLEVQTVRTGKNKGKPVAKVSKEARGRMVRLGQERRVSYLLAYWTGLRRSEIGKLRWQDIDLDFYQDFVEYLKSEKESDNDSSKTVPGLATNTIGKKIQTLKIMLNDAYSKDYPVNKAYKSHRFKNISEESDSIYLDENDLHKLFNLDLSKKPRLERVRDLFLVGCWTGCRYGDLPKINLYNIHNDMVHLEQAKTGKKVIIPLHEVVKQILEKYNYDLPKVITNQNYNKYIKEAAEGANINETVFKRITKGGIERNTKYKKWELITAHTARRSFATNLYKSGFPSRSIMEITGHKTESSFLKYIKVQPEEYAKMLEIHWRKNTRLTVVK